MDIVEKLELAKAALLSGESVHIDLPLTETINEFKKLRGEITNITLADTMHIAMLKKVEEECDLLRAEFDAECNRLRAEVDSLSIKLRHHIEMGEALTIENKQLRAEIVRDMHICQGCGMEYADSVIQNLTRERDRLRAEVATAKRDVLEAKQDVRDLLGLKDDNRRLRELLQDALHYVLKGNAIFLADRIDAALKEGS